MAPVTISTPSKGPFLPMNCPRNASLLHRSHTGGSCWLRSRVRVAMVPSPFRVTDTPTSAPLKPGAAAVSASPEGAWAGFSSLAAGAPKVTWVFCVLPRATSATHFRPLLTEARTASLVTVAPDRASKEPPSMALMPGNCSWKEASLARAPKPAVSAKLVSPTEQPVTTPSRSTPRVTATGPP